MMSVGGRSVNLGVQKEIQGLLNEQVLFLYMVKSGGVLVPPSSVSPEWNKVIEQWDDFCFIYFFLIRSYVIIFYSDTILYADICRIWVKSFLQAFLFSGLCSVCPLEYEKLYFKKSLGVSLKKNTHVFQDIFIQKISLVTHVMSRIIKKILPYMSSWYTLCLLTFWVICTL